MAIENLKKHLIIAPLFSNIAFWLYTANTRPRPGKKKKGSPNTVKTEARSLGKGRKP
jgi:hypothetical protein